MPLIFCPECRSEVSDRATACPHCGYPMAERLPTSARPAKPPKPRSYITTQFALGATAILAVLGGFAMGGAEEEGMAIFAGLMTWALAIPIWWKARHASRAAALPGVAEIERLIDSRLQNAEERFRSQLGDAQDSGRQIMELEERLEFMERLLTKVRDERLGPG